MATKVSKNQRVTTQQVVRGGAAFDGKPCGYCGAKTRRLYPAGRTYNSRWKKCADGHRLYRKGGVGK